MRFLFSTHLSGVLYEHQKWWCIDAVSHRIFSKRHKIYSSIFKSENIFTHFKNISFCGIIWEMIVTTLVFQGCHHGVPQTARLKHQTLIPPFRSSRPRPRPRWFPGMTDSRACWWPSSPWVLRWASLLCVCVPVSPSYKDISHIEYDSQWSPLQWPHFTLITSLETLSANAVTFCSARVRMSTYGFGRGSQFSL